MIMQPVDLKSFLWNSVFNSTNAVLSNQLWQLWLDSLLVVPLSTNQSADNYQSTNHRSQNKLPKTVFALLNKR